VGIFPEINWFLKWPLKEWDSTNKSIQQKWASAVYPSKWGYSHCWRFVLEIWIWDKSFWRQNQTNPHNSGKARDMWDILGPKNCDKDLSVQKVDITVKNEASTKKRRICSGNMRGNTM
jgi:hypothetical protein